MGIFIKQKTYITAVSVMLICILMIVFADTVLTSARSGIALWLSTVVPSLFPFFICVNFMTGTGIVGMLPVKVFPFAMSVLSGYPVGAKIVGDMRRKGTIDLNEAKWMMSFCSTSGPVFMVGAVGAGMLGSQRAGAVIALSHYAGAILNGLLFSGQTNKAHDNGSAGKILKEYNIVENITSAVFSASRSMAVILAYIIFFTFIMNMVNMTGLFEATGTGPLRSLFQGFLEMTVGCSSLTASGASLKTCCICASAIISWGGLSIIGQSMSMLSDTGIGFRYLLFTKLTHSIFAGIIALFLGNVML